MRLCIADPPYLPNRSRPDHKRASRWYAGPNSESSWRAGGPDSHADSHPEASDWDEPEKHRAMVAELVANYDGWAIAMAADSLFHYLQWVPAQTRTAVWYRPNAVPGGSALICSWEPVLVFIPQIRRAHTSRSAVRDVLQTNAVPGFAGAKPPAWTRWVLDMLGYNPDTDTVDDIFHGSGAVAAEIAQGVLL
jgi:hypothetical protein